MNCNSRNGAITLAAFMCAAFLFTGPAAASVYISGRVIADTTHLPVPDATVSLYKNGQSEVVEVARTLQNGSFVLRAPAPGAYRVEVEGSAVEPVHQSVDVPHSGVTGLELTVTLVPVLRVKLLDPQHKPVTGEQVRGWLVIIADYTDGGSHTHTSQGLGFTKISSPDGIVEYAAPQGSATTEATTVIVGARDATSGCGMLRLDKWPDGPVTLQLERGVTLSGQVLDKLGKPAPQVRVQVQPSMATTPPATPPTIIQLAQPTDGITAHRSRTGIITPAVEEDAMMQEGSPCFYQGSVRTKTDAAGHFEIPFLFSGCRVMVTFAIPGEPLKYQMVTLEGERMQIRLGA